MVTPQFLAAGKKNLEKCPTRHGKTIAGAGRRKSLLKGLMSTYEVEKEDVRKICTWILFGMSAGDFEDILNNFSNEIPVFAYVLMKALQKDLKRGKSTTLEKMLDIIYGRDGLLPKNGNGTKQ